MSDIEHGPEGPRAKSDFVGLTPKRFQRLLIENGFLAGEADGVWGPVTAEACEGWFADGQDLKPDEVEVDLK